MTGKHTPGPWTIYEIQSQSYGDGYGIRQESADREECAANMHLIAAAPDLLEACKQASAFMANCVPDWDGVLTRKQIDDAIAKAEGRA